MRILWHSPPPWCPSGYGTQTRLNAAALISMGHDVAISAYAGVHERTRWFDRDSETYMQILPASRRSYGNGQIAHNARMWNADAVILLCDLLTIEPGQLGQLGCPVFPWMPVDCDPLGEADGLCLQMAAAAGADIRPVAMSQHGRKMIEAVTAGQVPLVYHGIDTHAFRPDQAIGMAWRAGRGIPASSWLISMVGVNDQNDRKGFVLQLQAFAEFARKHKDAVLYLHTEAQDPGGMNLAKVALSLGLKHRVLFADEEERAADLHGRDYMIGMYNASNLLTAASRGEGFGIPVIEAMACGVPVVATRTSAQRELVPAGTGWLVGGQREWCRHHQSWWVTPSVRELVQAYERARSCAASYSTTARQRALLYDISETSRAWAGVLETLHQ
jgi:glycosyltransferase involved in cell wall biosynthesis